MPVKAVPAGMPDLHNTKNTEPLLCDKEKIYPSAGGTALLSKSANHTISLWQASQNLCGKS